MTLKPKSIADLSAALANANAAGDKIQNVDLSGFDQVKSYAPEDMTVTVETGITLTNFQAHLAPNRQWLPIDPPQPDTTTLNNILSHNLSGPRRFGHGTIREHLIGLTAILADGTAIKSGGNVVKNVAGYDLCKLFVGDRGTLGITVDATFKLLPLPETESFLTLRCQTVKQVSEAIRLLHNTPTQPTILDLDTLQTKSAWTLTIGFAGTRIETDWQTGQVIPIGFTPVKKLKEHAAFWAEQNNTLSVAPTQLAKAITDLKGRSLIARVGNGTIYHQGPPLREQPKIPHQLMKRIKDHFDPNLTLPQRPW